MSASASILSRFRHLLDEQSRLADALAHLLEEEWNALAASDPTPLESVTREKIDLALRLEHLESERRNLLARAGIYPEASEAVLRWMGTLDASGELARRWESLGNTLRQCRERNRQNGHALQLHRNRAEAALRVLSGESAGSTYSASGAPAGTGAHMHRNLGSA